MREDLPSTPAGWVSLLELIIAEALDDLKKGPKKPAKESAERALQLHKFVEQKTHWINICHEQLRYWRNKLEGQ